MKYICGSYFMSNKLGAGRSGNYFLIFKYHTQEQINVYGMVEKLAAQIGTIHVFHLALFTQFWSHTYMASYYPNLSHPTRLRYPPHWRPATAQVSPAPPEPPPHTHTKQTKGPTKNQTPSPTGRPRGRKAPQSPEMAHLWIITVLFRCPLFYFMVNAKLKVIY